MVYRSGCKAPSELMAALAPGLSGPTPLLLSTKELLRSIRLGGIRSGDRHRGGACLGLEGVGVSANEAKDPCASGAARTSSDAARSGEGERGAPHAPASNVRPSGANVRIAGEDPRWLVALEVPLSRLLCEDMEGVLASLA